MINELRSITTFVHTAELGSLSKAAEAQQISPQAASKALGQLESYLGVRLFHRTTPDRRGATISGGGAACPARPAASPDGGAPDP